jgi:hypothetical protein
LLTTLENTPLAMWVGESLWAYPSLLACHIVGLAIVVGLLTTRDLKLLGFFPGVAYQTFSDLMPVVVVAFSLNAVSGFLLFSSQASYLSTSLPFRAKLICIAVGLFCAINQQMRRKKSITSGVEEPASGHLTKAAACISLLAWVGAIIAGRLIAYIF